MKIHEYLKSETEWLPWSEALKNIAMLERLGIDSINEIMDWILPSLSRLEYETKSTDKPQQILLRNKIIFAGTP